MPARFLLPVTLFLLLVSSAMAQIRVVDAWYGAGNKGKDVTERVQRYADRGRLKFKVSNDNLGGDPARNREKTLTVTYVTARRKHTDIVKEGDTFHFRTDGGRPPVAVDDPFAPWWYLSRPPVTGDSHLRFRNETRRTVNIYTVDRFGRWYWVAGISGGARASFYSRVGQAWVVTDRSGHILQRVRARPGSSNVTLD
ncbi:MAG TPA: hypothetical protein VIT21_10050 [Chthoniobacterales bacterium]